MRSGSIIETVPTAVMAALLRDLPDIEYDEPDWSVVKNYASYREAPTITKLRRPREEEVVVEVYQQVWGNTALGYEGVGGQAITSAYTVMVTLDNSLDTAVYFGASGRLAYLIPALKFGRFAEYVLARKMPPVAEARKILNAG